MQTTLEETLGLARLLVGHPKTFSAAVIARILFNLEGCGFQGAYHLGAPRLLGTSRLPSDALERPHTAPDWKSVCSRGSVHGYAGDKATAPMRSIRSTLHSSLGPVGTSPSWKAVELG